MENSKTYTYELFKSFKNIYRKFKVQPKVDLQNL